MPTPTAALTEQDRLISKHGVGELLSLTVRQVEAYHSRGGVLPTPTRIGKHLRWKQSEIVALYTNATA